ncbi:MAG: hypothetical protein GWN01_10995 [Nitrosopumilaceae archaeon]|nr:hypothetical protein [Nitrosopumilaceae archaeon]NIU01413.1 hypothetical protein [Nitrosopumilaceae archaeon]NIU87771.1 hypothetical protein [Nitrosopumilaceae archaeon]NIV66149.1 hypothetical protein [Nitrosopumilaceae archaeon]NIX62015.1 hypothetical protein [Nitrosopumilaceae archaeon]
MRIKGIITLGIIAIIVISVILFQDTTKVGQPLVEETKIDDKVDFNIQKAESPESEIFDSFKSPNKP